MNEPTQSAVPADVPPTGFAWAVAHAWHGFWLYAGFVALLFVLPQDRRFLGNDTEVLVALGLPLVYLFALGATFRRSKRTAFWIFFGTLLVLLVLAGLPGYFATQRNR